MKNLTEDAVREIERIHSSWIEFEVTGKGQAPRKYPHRGQCAPG